jgi:hypothetical protein
MRSRCCLCVCIPPIAARQQLGKNSLIVARRNVTAVANTHVTIDELLDASFSMWPVSYQGKQAISSSHNFLFIETVSETGFYLRHKVKACSLGLNLQSSM